VFQLGDKLGFNLKAPDEIGVAGVFGENDLDDDLAVNERLPGAVNSAERALADLLDQLVALEGGQRWGAHVFASFQQLGYEHLWKVHSGAWMCQPASDNSNYTTSHKIIQLGLRPGKVLSTPVCSPSSTSFRRPRYQAGTAPVSQGRIILMGIAASPHTGERHSFASLDALFKFLEDQKRQANHHRCWRRRRLNHIQQQRRPNRSPLISPQAIVSARFMVARD
jgi:hypothetical protein